MASAGSDLFDNLVQWLIDEHAMDPASLKLTSHDFEGAGRGLVVNAELPYNPFVPPPDVVQIPTSALINVQTLRPHYPRSFAPPLLIKSSKSSPTPSNPLLPLTATQLITLHLALHCPHFDRHPSIPADPWGPFTQILPRSFHYHHPLTWLVDLASDKTDEEVKAQPAFARLFETLPDRVQTLVRDVEKRFKTDVDALRTILSTEQPFTATDLHQSLPLTAILWAWLQVNTRCLSHPLQLSPPGGSNDLTMAPIVDLINHSTASTPIPHTLPESRSANKATHYALPAPERKLGKGEQLFLQYGAHDDAFLFAEYGFVAWGGNEWNEIWLGEEIDALFDQLPAGEKEQKRAILEKEGYWGNYTLHSEPAPPHPSHRLLPALRLLHVPIASQRDPKDPSNTLRNWNDSLLGLLPFVSESNEDRTRQTLVGICERVDEKARSGLERLSRIEEPAFVSEVVKQEWENSVGNVKSLWDGLRVIAGGVKESCLEGIEF